jgi:hypothetical protein
MQAVVGSLTISFDVLDDGSGADEVFFGISSGPIDVVEPKLEEVPGLIVALQRVVIEAKRRGVEIGSPLPLVVHLD